MAIYRQNLTTSQAPATADVANVARVTAAANASDAKATAGLLELAGNVAWGAYEGKQYADLKADQEKSLSIFQNQYQELLTQNQRVKAAEERSILTEASKNFSPIPNTTTGLPKQEASILSSFKEEQLKIIEARDAMPQRQHEFMLRSEEILKKYIAKLPGLANNFRQITEEVTGKRGVDLYSVNRLYEDVNFIERKNQEAAKAQLELDAKLRTAFVNDLKLNGTGEYEANLMYTNLDSNSKLAYATASANRVVAKKNAEDAMKTGGQEVERYVGHITLSFDNKLFELSSATEASAKKLGISKAELASGNVQAMREKYGDPFVKLMDTAGSEILNALDMDYREAVKTLDARLSNKENPVDPASIRLARADLDKWYENSKKSYTDNKMLPLMVFAGNDDPQKTLDSRLRTAKSIVDMFPVPEEIAAQFAQTGKVAEQAMARYPAYAKTWKHGRDLMTAAQSGIDSKGWMELIKKSDEYVKDGISGVPANKTEACSAAMAYEVCANAVNKQVLNNDPINPKDVSRTLEAAMATPANMERFAGGHERGIDVALSKLSPQDKEVVKVSVNQKVNDLLYNSSLGYANEAKRELDTFKNTLVLDPQIRNIANLPNFKFKDASGNSNLSMVMEITPKTSLTPQQQSMFDNWKGTTKSEKTLNQRLTHIDNMLRVQSKVSGTPITQLRQDFIMTFNKAGMPSDVRVAPLVEGANAPTQTTTGNTTNKSTVDSSWIYQERR